MKKEWDFIALGISIYDSETTLKEVTRGLDHVVLHPFVKWSIKVMDFSSKAREIAAIDPRNHKEPRQDTMVMCYFKDPHPFSSPPNFMVPLLDDKVLRIIDAHIV